MSDEKWIVKDVEGCGCGLIWSSLRFQHLSWRKPRKTIVRIINNRVTSVGVAEGYRLDCQGYISSRGGIFLFSTVSIPPLGPTQPPIQWVPGTVFLGIKRLGREANHLPPSNAEVKIGGPIPLLPTMHWWRDAQFIERRDNFTFMRSLFNFIQHLFTPTGPPNYG
jgi:hypothetical protein